MDRLKTTKLLRPVELGCDYYLGKGTKCALAARYYLERGGECIKACEKHRAKLARVVGK